MLGRQQIAGVPTAISELYKNAHDAYATVAEADFVRYKGVFVLRDNGDGMSRTDFEGRWLTLGTSSKSATSSLRVDTARPRRAILGEKGIGRLAIAAIGPQTLVVTKARGHKRVAALVHWGVFELAHASLSEIKVPVVELEPSQGPDVREMSHQILANVRHLVTDDDPGLYDRIHQDLRRWSEVGLDEVTAAAGVDLAAFEPGTAFVIVPTSPDLEADLEAPPKEAAPLLRTLIGFANTMTPGHSVPELKTVFRYHRAPDDVRDLIEDQEFFTVDEFRKADHHFEGEFDEYGQFRGTVSVFDGPPQSYPLPWSPARGVRTRCGPFRLHLAYVQGVAKSSRLEANDFVAIGEKLDCYGGLYIYRNGVRVLPYGDSSFDWLDVEKQRTKSASDHFFSYRRMFGAVEITRERNSQLREKAGREGFATNEAYRQFREILKNFLTQVANEFFREGGPQAEAWEEGKLANERMDKARRVRSKQVRARRTEYSGALDRFFEEVNAGVPEAKVERILGDLRLEVGHAQVTEDPSTAVDLLVRAELSARSQLRELVSSLQVRRPRGVALSGILTRRSRLYDETRVDILESVLRPAEQQVDETLSVVDLQLDRAVHRRLRFDQSVLQAVDESRDMVSGARGDLQKQAAQVADRIKELVGEARKAVEMEAVAVLQQAATTELSCLTDPEFARLRNELETRVRAMAGSQLDALRAVEEQLRSVVWAAEDENGGTASLLDQVEQLEERVEVLTDRASQDFELVQIGLAVNIVTHEFENSIRSVRENLRRLKVWAQENASLRPLYSDLRTSFEHLDGYLRLFTPLHRRLYREPVEIAGTDVVRYLSDVFERRLIEEGVELNATAAFQSMRVRMFPSTLYAVLVNLVDNAVYWVAQYSGTREITLDKSEGLISVTDSGRGVSLGDEEVVFEQGFSRKPAGSGYGLFVAREVLRRDGADVRLAPPSADRGARFEILLPDGGEK
jgi:signal transduction histidine kinase